MKIYPAIDLYDGKAVRLYKGDYARMTVYSEDPVAVAKGFESAGAEYLHLVDLQGAKAGRPVNLPTIRAILENTNLFVEVGGGIRNMQTVRDLLCIGVNRVILGTAAVEDEAFLKEALARYGKCIAVGVDLKDGRVAIKGWTETAGFTTHEFFTRLRSLGVRTVICTDISRDGAMRGTNRALYQELAALYTMDIIASGGVSDMEDVKALAQMNLHGAIIGKAYYTGAIDLKEAIGVAK